MKRGGNFLLDGNTFSDPEQLGTESCLTKLDGKAAVSVLGIHVAGAPALSRAAGPRQRTNRALEPREGVYAVGRLGALINGNPG